MKKIRYLGYRVTINYGSDQFCSLRENYVIVARALPDAGPEHLLFYTLNKVNNSMPKNNMYSAVLHNKLSIGKKITRIIRIKYISSAMRSLLVFLNTDNILSLARKRQKFFYMFFLHSR